MAVGMLSETTPNLESVRDRLQTERDRLKQLLGAVTGTLHITMGDDETSAKLRVRLTDVKKAIGRIDNGTYGHCTACSTEISASRLETLPTATHCMACEMMGGLG
jgi:RNA polymerase-binding transcription factor DksA